MNIRDKAPLKIELKNRIYKIYIKMLIFKKKRDSNPNQFSGLVLFFFFSCVARSIQMKEQYTMYSLLLSTINCLV